MAIKPFNSVGGFSIGETPSNVIYANGDFAGNKANFTGNVAALGLLTDNLYYANGTPWDFQEAAGSNTEIQFNMGDNFAASANLTFNDAIQLFTVLGNGQFNNANLGNLAIANFVNVASNVTTSNLSVNLAIAGNTASFSGNVILPNLTVNANLSGNVANFSGNLNSLNANLGNLATANYVNVANELNGNVANFSGNLTSLNANLGNLATANYINVANDVNVIGNVSGANFIGALANGNSNVKVYNNANVEITVNGIANIATFTSTEFLVVGEIKSTAGNMLSNGNVTANGFLNGANANITGEAILGSVKTATITAPTGNITISAAGTNENIVLVPTGTGAINASGKKIIQLADPTNPTDAATKEYVDAMAGEGLDIHTPVRVETPTALNATYVQGGTTPTVSSISGGTNIDFGSAHGLSVDDGIVFTNSFNGLTGGEAYWVFSVPSPTSITVKDGYFGPQITTLSNGTGLAEPSRANPGVGATLTNAGANAALVIDNITLSNTNRVLVYNQVNAYENGVYTVTNAGNGSTAWVLTRATDFNKYSPDTPNGLSAGSYVFVTQGLTGAGESYVMTAPLGEVIIGTDNITFTQFSAAGSYTAGNGINIIGTAISANVDGITTDIVGGNIVVKASAQLTTPNIGAATGTSLNVTGNVDANGLSIANLANIGGNLTVAGYIFSNNAIASNANVSGTNLNASGNVEVGGNVVAGNITANATVFAANANVSGTTITNVLTVNTSISGNSANFSGNIVANNATVNLELAGNTANFSGNVIVPNISVNLAIAGNTANFTGNITAANISTGGALSVTGNANVGNLGTGGLITATGNITGGNLVTGGVVSATGNVNGSNVVAANGIYGNTANITGNAAVGGILTDNYYYANGAPVDFQQAAGSNTQVQFNSNNDFGASANFTFDTTTNVLTVSNGNVSTGNLIASGLLSVTGNANVGNLGTAGLIVATGNITGGNLNTSNTVTANTITANTSANIGNTTVGWGTLTTTGITANQTIAQFSTTGIAAIEFLVKGVDSTGAKYSVATISAVTDGTSVDYATYATAYLGSGTGSLSVNVSSGNVALQVTPASSNSTVWTTQYRVM
jgi:hypothetical protein